jgi:RHS repeat-associated protein
LAYDPALRLFQTVGAGVTTLFGYDGADLIGEYNASTALLRRYVHGPGGDEPLVWYEGSGLTDRRFPLADERGSIIAITDASGTVTNINAYDEYGIPAASNVGRFGYTGQTWLPEVGLNYYKARMYSPTLGRFMQTDPIGYGDGINWYAYVGNDPVNATDPDGQFKLFKFLGKVVKAVALNFAFRAVGNVIGVGSSAGRVSSLAPDTRPKPSRGPLSTPNPFDRPLSWVLNADSDTAGDIVVNGRRPGEGLIDWLKAKLIEFCPRYARIDGKMVLQSAYAGGASNAYRSFKFKAAGYFATGAAAGAAIGSAAGGVGALPGAVSGGTNALITGVGKDTLVGFGGGAAGSVIAQCKIQK